MTSAPDRPTRRRTASRLSRLRAPRMAALEASPTMAGTSMAHARSERIVYCCPTKPSWPAFWAASTHAWVRSGCLPRLWSIQVPPATVRAAQVATVYARTLARYSSASPSREARRARVRRAVRRARTRKLGREPPLLDEPATGVETAFEAFIEVLIGSPPTASLLRGGWPC